MRSDRRPGPIPALAALVLLAGTLVVGCAADLRRFPAEEPMWEDPDRRPFLPKPEEYFSPFAWDAVDQTIFRPFTRLWKVERPGESVNVNALGEVPDSSWFENRLGHRDMTVEEVAEGACGDDVLQPEGPWTVTSGKPGGANPGFVMEAADGRRYLLKFDGLEQPERATSADVIASRIYWALGYRAPCNATVFFPREILSLSDQATKEDSLGREVPLGSEDVEAILAMGVRTDDGRYRAVASRYLEGEPLGPWRYQGTRDDDPNDVIPHEDRRELRAGYVVASWINHFDTREQNTLAMFVRPDGEDGPGFVRHHMIDFGDSLGSLWRFDGMSRRHGHANYLDVEYVLVDFFTLGLFHRPWDTDVARMDPRTGKVFGYFGAERFDPARWEPGYPNPAFSRMTRRDAFWMARKMARLSDAHVEAIVARARFLNHTAERVLVEFLLKRRDAILRRWIGEAPFAPLDRPEVRPSPDGATLCMVDVARLAGLVEPDARTYAVTLRDAGARATAGRPEARREADHEICVPLPAAPPAGTYLLVDVTPNREGSPDAAPARAHLVRQPDGWLLVGLERPERPGPPDW
ncbi:MAG: hypothetical protein ACQEXJ_01600 [Myxococcota bacterium]